MEYRGQGDRPGAGGQTGSSETDGGHGGRQGPGGQTGSGSYKRGNPGGDVKQRDLKLASYTHWSGRGESGGRKIGNRGAVTLLGLMKRRLKGRRVIEEGGLLQL